MVIVPEAEAEVGEAIEWYDAQRPGVGAALLAEVRAAVRSLEDGFDGSPYLTDASVGEVRRLLLGRFPYALCFSVREAAVEVIAFAHLRRQPGYWREGPPR